VNELLRRFLLQAGLREDDVAAHLGVDPKTVRRWLNGRVPYPHNRAAVADLLGAEESDLWPGASGTLTARIGSDELSTVYPHRSAVPQEVWMQFFGSAEHEIDILAYSALFLAEDRGILRLLAGKGRAGVKIRVALGDPESSRDDATLHGGGGIRDDVPANIRKALALYQSVAGPTNVEIRLHKAVLYHSTYRADDQLLVNQHTYGIPAAHAPVFCLRNSGTGEITALYSDSFERLWANAAPLA
jgi:transcriptional regulator with XRE-family HTH domain